MSSIRHGCITFTAAYVITTAYFFYKNAHLGRGEDGTREYVVTKCAPIIALAICTLLIFSNRLGKLAMTTFLGTLAGLMGDYFLAFRSQHDIYFLLGIFPFATSHIVYWIGFNKGAKEYRILPLLAVLNAITMYQVIPKVPDIATYVAMCAYAVVITFATWMSISDYLAQRGCRGERMYASVIRMLGFLLFCASDTLLITDAYVKPIYRAQHYVMITYYLAQFLIVMGNFVENEINEDEGPPPPVQPQFTNVFEKKTE